MDSQIIEALRFRIVLDLKEAGTAVENDNESLCEIPRVIDAVQGADEDILLGIVPSALELEFVLVPRPKALKFAPRKFRYSRLKLSL